VNLPVELWERLDAMAESEGRSRSNMVARLVEAGLGEGAAGGRAEARDACTADRDPDAPSPSFRPDFKKP